jgi:hypothetical protein
MPKTARIAITALALLVAGAVGIAAHAPSAHQTGRTVHVVADPPGDMTWG